MDTVSCTALGAVHRSLGAVVSACTAIVVRAVTAACTGVGGRAVVEVIGEQGSSMLRHITEVTCALWISDSVCAIFDVSVFSLIHS